MKCDQKQDSKRSISVDVDILYRELFEITATIKYKNN